MSRLASASTAEEKQGLMARIRSIQTDMSPSTTASTPPSTSKLNGSPKVGLSEKERLDKELEMHKVQSALRSESQGGDNDAAGTSALKDKLAQLKAEVRRSRYTVPSQNSQSLLVPGFSHWCT